MGNRCQQSLSPSSRADFKVIGYLSLQAVEDCVRLQPHKVQEESDGDTPQANHRWARQWGNEDYSEDDDIATNCARNFKALAKIMKLLIENEMACGDGELDEHWDSS